MKEAARSRTLKLESWAGGAVSRGRSAEKIDEMPSSGPANSYGACSWCVRARSLKRPERIQTRLSEFELSGRSRPCLASGKIGPAFAAFIMLRTLDLQASVWCSLLVASLRFWESNKHFLRPRVKPYSPRSASSILSRLLAREGCG